MNATLDRINDKNTLSTFDKSMKSTMGKTIGKNMTMYCMGNKDKIKINIRAWNCMHNIFLSTLEDIQIDQISVQSEEDPSGS